MALPVNPLLGKFLTLGQVLCLGAVLQLLAQLMRPWGPFPLYATSFFLCAFGMALQDSYSNTFVTSVGLAHRWLGLIHASYAAGLAVGASTFLSRLPPDLAELLLTSFPGTQRLLLLQLLPRKEVRLQGWSPGERRISSSSALML